MLEKLTKFVESALDDAFFDNHPFFFYNGRFDSVGWLHDAFVKESATPKTTFLEQARGKIEFEVRTKQYLHDLLEDEYSREMLIRVAAYRILGPLHVRFPMFRKDSLFIKQRLVNEYARPCAYDGEISRYTERARFFDLSSSGVDLRLITQDENVYALFTNQMEYTYGGAADIKAEPGDVVLDCGACFGDTALFFARAVGSGGKVVSFEPNPEMLRICKLNLGFNRELAKRVQLVAKAVCESDGAIMDLRNH